MSTEAQLSDAFYEWQHKRDKYVGQIVLDRLGQPLIDAFGDKIFVTVLVQRKSGSLHWVPMDQLKEWKGVSGDAGSTTDREKEKEAEGVHPN